MSSWKEASFYLLTLLSDIIHMFMCWFPVPIIQLPSNMFII